MRACVGRGTTCTCNKDDEASGWVIWELMKPPLTCDIKLNAGSPWTSHSLTFHISIPALLWPCSAYSSPFFSPLVCSHYADGLLLTRCEWLNSLRHLCCRRNKATTKGQSSDGIIRADMFVSLRTSNTRWSSRHTQCYTHPLGSCSHPHAWVHSCMLSRCSCC